MKKLLKEFFFLTRGERRALVFVAILLLTSLCYRIWIGNTTVMVPEEDVKLVEFMEKIRREADSISAIKQSHKKTQKWELEELKLAPFMFDPNTIPKDSLLLMQIPIKVVSNLLRYREAGGSFSNAKELQKIYGMNATLYEALAPYVMIKLKEKMVETVDSLWKDSKYEAREWVIEKVCINSADTSDLLHLPGIGPSYARRLIKYRDLLGGYYADFQLLEVYGMDTARYNSFVDYVIIDTALIVRKDLNTVSFRDLLTHPYISREITYAILQYRDYIGIVSRVKELEDNEILDSESFIKIAPYLEVEFNKD